MVKEYKSDIEIAQEAVMLPIKEVAKKLDIEEDDLELYGKYKAKLSDEFARKIENNKDGKLVLVTAINPTPAGEGKTTTTVNLGVGLINQGYKVLLIDADPQGDLTTSLGWYNNDDMQHTLASLIGSVIQDKEYDISEAILHHAEGMDVIPSNIELADMETQLVTTMNREATVKRIIDGIKDEYDYILIDCMPSLGMITVNALTASDTVIIPVQAQFLPAKGMTSLLTTINKVNKHLNPNLEIEGVLITLADRRTNLSKQTANMIRCNFGEHIKVFDVEIPVAVKAAETSAHGASILKYDAKGTVAQAYSELAKEVGSNGWMGYYKA